MPVRSPDLNTYLCVQMGSLAMMAEALGMDAEAGHVATAQQRSPMARLEFHQDEQAGFQQGNPQPSAHPGRAPFGLYPLWTKLATRFDPPTCSCADGPGDLLGPNAC